MTFRCNKCGTTTNSQSAAEGQLCPLLLAPGGCDGKLVVLNMSSNWEAQQPYIDAAAEIVTRLGLPITAKPEDIVDAFKELQQRALELETKLERNESATAAEEREVGNRYKMLIDVVAECLGTVDESGYVPAFGEPLTNQLRRAWRAVNRNGESAIVALAVDDKIDNICKLMKAKLGGDAGVVLHTRRDGFKATAVSGIPVAGGDGFLASRGLTVEVALDNLEEKLCHRVGKHLDAMGEALKHVEQHRHPLITLDPALEKPDAK